MNNEFKGFLKFSTAFVFVVVILTTLLTSKGLSQVVLINLDQDNSLSFSDPAFVPFGDTSQVLDQCTDDCCKGKLTFSNIDGPFNVAPALDFFETGSQQSVDGDGVVSFDFTQIDPNTQQPLDPGSNSLGISIVPSGASSFFDVFVEIDCPVSTSTSSSTSSSTTSSSTSSSSSSSSGSVVSSSSSGAASTPDLFKDAIKHEVDARKLIRPFSAMFDATGATSNINASISTLQELSTRLSGSTITFAMGMTTIQQKLTETIAKDNEAISEIDGITEFTPDLGPKVNKARRALKQAINCKKRMLKKVQREERRSSMSSMSMSSMSMGG